MEILSILFTSSYEIMNIDITLFGFTFSFWDVFIWSLVAGIIGYLIVRFFVHD